MFKSPLRKAASRSVISIFISATLRRTFSSSLPRAKDTTCGKCFRSLMSGPDSAMTANCTRRGVYVKAADKIMVANAVVRPEPCVPGTIMLLLVTSGA
ncbi:Uncharacterised protein [Mycobacteroides abscessus subsp. abscessus]|nr:Uncharacterised protein [Mycobacteroides abscessus subsp. abscessus]